METCSAPNRSQSWKWDGSKFISYEGNQEYALSLEKNPNGDTISIRKYNDPNNTDKVNWKGIINPVNPGAQTFAQSYFYVQSSSYPSTCLYNTYTDPNSRPKAKQCLATPSFQWDFTRV
jgi:hypothetical protein